MRARRLLAAAAILVTLAAAGCGSDVKDSNAYVDKVNIAQTQLLSSFQRLSREISVTTTAAQNRKTLRGLQDAVNANVAALKAIKPPEKVKSQHADLVESIAAYSEALGVAEQGLSGGPTQAALAVERLKADNDRTSTRVTTAISAINQKLRD